MNLITKSLFVDYGDFPKLAWWKVNDLGVYKKINDLEDEEKEAEIIQLGQDVEDKVGEYLFNKYGEERFDVFEDNPIKDLEDEEDEDIANSK